MKVEEILQKIYLIIFTRKTFLYGIGRVLIVAKFIFSTSVKIDATYSTSTAIGVIYQTVIAYFDV